MNIHHFTMVNAALEERCHSMLKSSTMTSQRFCLRWNNHQSNLLSVFDQLLQEQCFVDVTLAVEGRLLRAHKMVLSACSPYFQTLFTEHPDKHPIVILKDVPYVDMRCLLDFMYRGEVSVNQDRLTAFLKVAETLRIKGLTEVNDDKPDIPTLTNSLVTHTLPPPQLHRISPRTSSLPFHPHLHGSNPNPSMVNASAAPLLGSALTAPPKRKRGRPRKLSGGSEMETESDCGASDADGLALPELLEVRMEDGREDRCSNGDVEEEDGRSPGPEAEGGFHLESLLREVKSENRRSSEESLQNPDYNSTPSKQERSSDYSSPSTATVKTERSSPSLGSGSGLNLSSDGGGGGGSGGGASGTSGHHQGNKPVVRRRVRRRANSSSQDPAEQLTEMSVRDQPSPETTTATALIKQESADVEDSVDEEGSSGASQGYHFLSSEDPVNSDRVTQESINEIIDNLPKARSDLLEYFVRNDGTVACKWCGEVLPSRTHWYRHKYKLHVPTSGLPAGLIKCIKCNTFFKSRKGYVGHCVARHGSVEEAEKEEDEVIIKTELVEFDENSENVSANVDSKPEIVVKGRKKTLREEMKEDYIRQREREEKLVADIIAKVKKECEDQSITMCRRGYSRRSTVMTSFKEYDKRK